MTLVSDAFTGLGEFAGVGAVDLPVDATGHFDSTVTLDGSVADGTYSITGRCGGGNLGVEASHRSSAIFRRPARAWRSHRGSGAARRWSSSGSRCSCLRVVAGQPGAATRLPVAESRSGLPSLSAVANAQQPRTRVLDA